MSRKSCQSGNQRNFSGELNINFPGLRNATTPTVWVFSELVVCLDCGLAEFKIPEAELQRLTGEDAADAAKPV
jgi:hypothetical protein